MKIEVKPIEKKRWHNKTGSENFARPKTLNVLIDSEKRQYATGLDYVNKVFQDVDDKRTKITEAEYYGKLLGVDLSAIYIEGKLHPFWDSKTPRIKLENKTMFFDTENPLDYIKIKIMKASKFVANSLKEYEEGFYPEATHIITDEREEVEAKASKIALKKQAIMACFKLGKERKSQLIMVINGMNTKNRSDDFVEVELDKIIEKQPSELLRYINLNPSEVYAHAMILEALQKGVLRKQGHKILYHDAMLGNDIDEVIAYFLMDENQELKLKIISAINN